MRVRIQKFIAELRSRSVFRAIVAYTVACWMLLQVADVTFDRLPLPENAMTILITLVVLGFPVTLILAWGYEFTKKGIVRHEDADGAGPRMAFTSYIVMVVAVSVAAASLLYYFAGKLWEPPPRSIAVLPFENVANTDDTEYFANGLTEEIQNLIVRLNEFRVIAFTTSHQFKDTVSDVMSIATRLDADVILQGSVSRYRDGVSVKARLIDGSNGLSIWSETYERKLEDATTIQEDIARQVARALHVVLPISAERRLANLGTKNIDAYDLYLRGLEYLRQPLDQVTLGLAETNLRRAIALDPDFVNALAAMCQLHLARYRKTADASLFATAEESCEEALEHDAESAQIYAALGTLYFESGKYEQAIEQYQEALDYNQNYADAYIGIGKSLVGLERYDEAEQYLRSAIEQDVSYWASFNSMGNFLFRRSRFLEAAEFYKMYIGRANDDSQAYNNLGAAYYMAGDFAQAAIAWEASLEIKATKSSFSNTGLMYYYLGDFEEAADRFAQAVNLSPNDYVLWGNLADAYYQVDEMKPAAITAYQRAVGLAEAKLAVNRSDIDTMSSLAFYYSRTGKDKLAHELNEQAAVAGADNMYVQFNSALIHVNYGDTEKALDALNKALNAGFQIAMLTSEPGLKPLHGNLEFRRMIDEAGS